MDERTFYDEILFVVVVYERLLSSIASLKSIPDFYKNFHSQPLIFVYDNSKQSQITTSDSILYHHDHKNSGVSRAYNEGLKVASAHNKRWLCLLDHDTDLDRKTLTAYSESFKKFQDVKVFVPLMLSAGKVVSPYKTFLGKGISINSINIGQHSFLKFKIINSGLLISVETFRLAGGYDENYPLDLSDYVFCERLSKVTKHFVVVNASCNHEFSSNMKRSLEEDISRFRYFSNATKQLRRDTSGSIFRNFALSLRSIKLSWKFKDLTFIKIAIQSIF